MNFIRLEIVPLRQHWEPIVAIEIMNCATRRDYHDTFPPQLTKSPSNSDVENRIEACIEADNCCRRGAFRKHPPRGSNGVIMPIKSLVCFDVFEMVFFQKRDDSFSEIHRDVYRIVFPALRVYHVHLDLIRVEFGGYLDAVIQFFPVGANEYYALNIVCECIYTELGI